MPSLSALSTLSFNQINLHALPPMVNNTICRGGNLPLVLA
jgi:hypothetical protein